MTTYYLRKGTNKNIFSNIVIVFIVLCNPLTSAACEASVFFFGKYIKSNTFCHY